MADRKRALVVGATGVVGRAMLRHLLATGGWEVLAVSRRKPDVEGQYEPWPLTCSTAPPPGPRSESRAA